MALACRSTASSGGLTAGRRRAGRPQPLRPSVLCHSRLLHGEHGHGNHSAPWFQKQKELWLELSSQADLLAAFEALPPGKMLVTDYYAGWCAVCKTAYPAMCRIAADKAFEPDFVFAKASLDNPEIKEWIKAEGVRGLPHLAVYLPSGTKVLGMGASFKKAEAIRQNLSAIAEHKEVVQQQRTPLSLDPNQFVLIPGASVAAPA